MKRAVCGFFFNNDRTSVVLIRKNRPSWQAGKLNGVGGKTEEGEFALDTMIREFEEETGVHHESWQEFCQLRDETRQHLIHFFRAFGDHSKCTSTTDEQIEIIPLKELSTANTLSNLTWLIPLALDTQVLPGEEYKIHHV